MGDERRKLDLRRRELLRRAAVLGATTIIGVPGCDDSEGDGLPEYEYEGEPATEEIFGHGVASGDPRPDAVILWTRVTVDEDAPVEGFFEVALDEKFSERVAADYVTADPDRDHTIKIDVTDLAAGTTYYYRFFARGVSSPVGRTRTAPEGATERLRFAVCSCSSLAHGYFHAYRRIAERTDLDLVVHLGDYIYEYPTGDYGNVRHYEPEHETVTLEDYRIRYAQYRRDPDLQEVHRIHPFVTVWDDHESANDAYADGAENHMSDTEGEWSDRKLAARQAYFEWMPIREGMNENIYRALSFGDLVDLVMLDTRSAGRDAPATSNQDVETLDDPTRSILGDAQEQWLSETLRESSATWSLIGQQVMMGQLASGGVPLNLDQWDGYRASRNRVLSMFEEQGNVVVLTGDIHSSWAMDLTEDPLDPERYDPDTHEGAVAVEFVTPGITSPGLSDSLAGLANGLKTQNPHLSWVDPQQRGYMVLDITRERVQAAWFHIDDVTDPEAGNETFAAAYSVSLDTPGLREDDAPAKA